MNVTAFDACDSYCSLSLFLFISSYFSGVQTCLALQNSVRPFLASVQLSWSWLWAISGWVGVALTNNCFSPVFIYNHLIWKTTTWGSVLKLWGLISRHWKGKESCGARCLLLSSGAPSQAHQFCLTKATNTTETPQRNSSPLSGSQTPSITALHLKIAGQWGKIIKQP